MKEQIKRAIEFLESKKKKYGRNDPCVGCSRDFGWLLEPSNIIKVLEGKYSRKNATASEKQSYDPEAYEKMNVFDIN